MSNAAFDVFEGDDLLPVVLACDHATNLIPDEYACLGLCGTQMGRHIAYDIGAEAMTRAMARALNVPAVFSRFSRLLIDPNRGEDDPTLVMRFSDGALIPGNARVGAEEVERRLMRFYRPYQNALRLQIERVLRRHGTALLFSNHSFTPVFRGKTRPMHAAVLWDSDPRLALPVLHALRADPALVVGDNDPYDGALKGDTFYTHATARGLPGVLIEVRQDLIDNEQNARQWGQKLADILADILAQTPISVFMPQALPTCAI